MERPPDPRISTFFGSSVDRDEVGFSKSPFKASVMVVAVFCNGKYRKPTIKSTVGSSRLATCYMYVLYSRDAGAGNTYNRGEHRV